MFFEKIDLAVYTVYEVCFFKYGPVDGSAI